MANNNYVYQQMRNVSIPRDGLVKIATSNILEIDDYKVILMLLTQLDGFNPYSTNGIKPYDPLNFKKIDVEKIADTLEMKKKAVKKSIERIFYLSLIDIGDSETISNGYRFTF